MSSIFCTCSMSTGQISTQAPQFVQAQSDSSMMRCRRAARCWPSSLAALSPRAAISAARAVVEELLLDAENDLLRPERLIRRQRRTDTIAAPTLGTGVAVEQLLPGELRTFETP